MLSYPLKVCATGCQACCREIAAGRSGHGIRHRLPTVCRYIHKPSPCCRLAPSLQAALWQAGTQQSNCPVVESIKLTITPD